MVAPPAERRWTARRIGCGHCGAVFECGNGGRNGGCWCVDEPYRVAMPTTANGDCLCPNCLRALASSPPKERAL